MKEAETADGGWVAYLCNFFHILVLWPIQSPVQISPTLCSVWFFCLFLAPGELCEDASEGQSGAHVPSRSAPSRDSPCLYFTVPHSACWLWVLQFSGSWLWVLEHSHGSLSVLQLFRGINVVSRGYTLTLSSRRFTWFIVSSDIFSWIYVGSSTCTLSNVELWVDFFSSRTFTWFTVSSITFRGINVASRVYTLAISSRRFTLLVLKLSVRFMWNPLLTDLLLLIFEF